MTNIKKLFLTFSLLAVQSTCGMDAEWIEIKSHQEYEPFVGNFMVAFSQQSPHSYVFIAPKQTHFARSFYPIHGFTLSEDTLSRKSIVNMWDDGTQSYITWAGDALRLRYLTFEDARLLHAAIKSKKINLSLKGQINSDHFSLPDDGKDFFKLRHLREEDRNNYVHKKYSRRLLTFIGIRNHRKSILNTQPKDVILLIARYGFAQAKSDETILEFE